LAGFRRLRLRLRKKRQQNRYSQKNFHSAAFIEKKAQPEGCAVYVLNPE
jgi:hypothetical protein